MDRDISLLLSKRDMFKSAAKKSMIVARMALNTLASQNGFLPTNGTGNNSREAETEKSDIFLAIVGEQGQQVIDQQRANLQDLKSKVHAGEPERMVDLRSTEEDYVSERQIIAQRIAELRQSIEKLEMYDAELCAKVLDIQAEIESDVTSRSAKNVRLDESLSQAQAAVKFGNSVGSLVDLLKIYDDSLEKAVNGSGQAFSSTDNMGEVVSSKMDAFLVGARNYFTSEAECVDFLRTRIMSSQKTVGELVSCRMSTLEATFLVIQDD
jgi:small-conductance mechanosensitive channel